MAVFAISDLHLSLGIDKPMDIFGDGWKDYMKRIKTEWCQAVGEEDYVIIPGDISWATYLKDAKADFEYIDALPGKKIISKGNHDYWWTTIRKLEMFLEENSFKSISFMHNNSFRLGRYLLCGTRGWNAPGDEGFGEEDRKIYNRELSRLENSLKSAGRAEGDILVAALHFPPFNSRQQPAGFVDIMKKYGVDICIYGHLHADGLKNAVEGEVEGIYFKLVSADYLRFKPLKLP